MILNYLKSLFKLKLNNIVKPLQKIEGQLQAIQEQHSHTHAANYDKISKLTEHNNKLLSEIAQAKKIRENILSLLN